jgi:hypothetical protein
MSRYRTEDGTVVDTANASASWEEAMDWDGSNHISRATGSQWDHQKLYKSRRGRYYIECWSQWQGSRSHIEWVSREEAARWLLHNDEKLPSDLAELETEVSE